MNIVMTEDDALKSQESGSENIQALSAQNIKNILNELQRDRNWLAESLNRSISTVNGWLSAGKPIPVECVNEMKDLFVKERNSKIKAAKSITAASNEEWNRWEKLAEFLHGGNVQEWAREALSKEYKKLSNKIENGTYLNVAVFPIDSKSEEFWELVYDFPKITEIEKGFYAFSQSIGIKEILDAEARKQLTKEFKENPKFSIKFAEKSNLDYFTDEDFEQGFKMFIFHPKDVYMWSIAAKLSGFASLNEWANRIIDSNVEKILLTRMGINKEDEDNGLPVKVVPRHR